MESRSYASVMDWECLEDPWRGSDVAGVLEQPFFVWMHSLQCPHSPSRCDRSSGSTTAAPYVRKRAAPAKHPDQQTTFWSVLEG